MEGDGPQGQGVQQECQPEAAEARQEFRTKDLTYQYPPRPPGLPTYPTTINVIFSYFYAPFSFILFCESGLKP